MPDGVYHPSRHPRFALLRLVPGIPLLLAGACTEYEYAERTGRDRYVQGGLDAPPSDVLFVLDDSPSMAEEQAALTENFQAFVDAMADTLVDFQLGAITTDPADAGALLGPPLTADSEDLAARFLEMVDVGTSGSRDEQGLEAARLCLQGGAPSGFFRDDARLNLVFFSDEDDHSPLDVDVYHQEYRSAVGKEGVTAHAIVGDLPGGCASGTSAADAGWRYVDLVDATSGLQDSICADDYSEILARIGLDVAGLIDIFYLTELPDPGTIRVWVDGVEMFERPVDGWQYGLGDNAVVFSGNAVPRPGMVVNIEYELQVGELSESSDDPGTVFDTD